MSQDNGSKGGKPTPTSQPITKGGEGQFGGKGPSGGSSDQQSSSSSSSSKSSSNSDVNSGYTVTTKGGTPLKTSTDTSVIKGGSGQFGGSGSQDVQGLGFGGGRVSFDQYGNRLVDGKIQQDANGNPIFASKSARDAYLSDRGLGNNSTITNQDKFDNADFSGLGVGKSNQSQDIFGSGGGQNKSVLLTESVGVGDSFLTETTRGKAGKKSTTNEGFGGVETPQSKELGSRYGWEALSGKSESIGSKIFTNQKQFTRDSSLESQTKASEASRASTIFSSKANPRYENLPADKTFGGPQTKESTGKAFGTGNYLIRDSPFEKQTQAKEAEKASKIYPTNEKSAFFTSNTSVSEARQSTVFAEPKTTTTPPKDVFFRTDYFVTLGETVGVNESLGGRSKSPSTFKEQKEFAVYLYNQEKPGVSFLIKNKEGKTLETTSGQRTRYDFLKAQGKYGNDIYIEPHYNFTAGQLYEYNTKLPEKATGSVNFYDVIGGAGRTLLSAGGSLAGLGLSLSGYIKKAFENPLEYNKENAQKLYATESYLVTGGYKAGTLLKQGTFEIKESPPLTQRGQEVISKTSAPTIQGANLGVEKGNETKGYYLGSAFGGGILIGSMAEGVYGAKGVVPFRVTKIPLPYNEGVTPARVLSFGYEGKNAYIIGGYGNSKFFRGTPKEENLQLNKLAPTTTREGFESGTGKPIQNKIITQVVVPALEKQGKLTKTGALDILETGKEGGTLATKSPTVQFRGFGEKPFRNLTPEQTTVLFDFLKGKKFTVTGSTAEIPFTKEGLVSQARDVDIKGVPKQKALKFTEEIATNLNQKALPNQLFEAKGTSVVLTAREAGQVRQEKILEFPQHELQQGYGLSPEEKGYVFGNKVPTGTNKVEGLKTVEYDYQGLRKIASSTELHIEDTGDIIVRASSGREVKDPAHVFSFLKTKAYNYLLSGKIKEGNRLNLIAENYRARHPELDFSKEYRGVNVGVTLELEQKPSVLSGIFSKSLGESKKASSISNIEFGSSSIYPTKSSSLFRSRTLPNSGISRESSKSTKSGKSNIGEKPSSIYSILNGKSKIISGYGNSRSSPGQSKSNISKPFSNISSISESTKSPSNVSSVSSNSVISVGSESGNLSGFSSRSGRSSILSITSTIFPSKNPLLPALNGSIGRKRKYKTREGPTALIHLGTKNVLAPSLSIEVPKNKRFEF